MTNSDKVQISLHNPGPSSPVVQQIQNGSSNGSQTSNFNGSSKSNGGQNGSQPPYNGGQPPNNGGQPAFNGEGTGGGQGSGAQKMSAPR